MTQSRTARLWQAAPPPIGDEFNPAALVQVTNDLHAMGEEEATRLVRAHAEELDHPSRDDEHGPVALGRLYLVVRLLWCPAPPHPAWPELRLGRPDIALPPPDAIWPLSPLVLSEDLPFLLVGGYKLGGGVSAATASLERMLAMAKWRPLPLSPRSPPMVAMQRLIDTPEWHERVPAVRQAWVRDMLKGQALHAEETMGLR